MDGGVTAIEVTMTVPRAVALIEELAATLPQASDRRRHRARSGDGPSGDRMPAREFVVSPGVPAERGRGAATRCDVPAMPGLLSRPPRFWPRGKRAPTS